MRAVIEDVFARHMQGENPENIELMFRRAYSSGFTQRPDPTVIGAAGSDGDGRVFGAGNRLLGHTGKRSQSPRSRPAWRTDERPHPGLYISIPIAPPRHQRLLDLTGNGR